MSLTIPQRQTLRDAMLAIPTLAAAITAGDTPTLLAWANGASATSAWRAAVEGSEIYDAHKPKEYQARSAGERGSFDLMVLKPFASDFTVAKVRNGVAAIFSGSTNSSCRTDIFAAAQEMASNAELVFGGAQESVGGSADMAETVTALDRAWEGEVEQVDIDWIVAQVLAAQQG